jgi:hypothetical protein
MDSDAKKTGKRGRPRNSGKNDSQSLRAVADLLVANAGMAPWTAISKVVGEMPASQHPNVLAASVVHRLNEKWRTQRATLLADAQRRKAEKEAEAWRERSRETARRMEEFLQVAECAAAEFAMRAAPVVDAIQQSIGRWMAKPETVAMLEVMQQVQISPQVQQALSTLASVKIDPAAVALAEQVGRMRIELDRSVVDAWPRIA